MIGGKHTEGVARFVVHPTAGNTHDKVPRFLERTRFAQQSIFRDERRKRVVLVENWDGGSGY
jgi:hypothetical protein